MCVSAPKNMIMKFCFLFFLLSFNMQLIAQRVLPKRSKEEKNAVEQIQKRSKDQNATVEDRWNPRTIPGKSKGIPETSAWHTGTAGIIPGDAAEISLFNQSRIGFSKSTELLFRIAEEPFLPNIGLKHHWFGKKKWFFSSEHTLYYTYPLLKIVQSTGFKELVPDSVNVSHGFAMRNELILSWLMNPREFGCPAPGAERILSMRAGVEFYMGDSPVKPFDYAHSLYHSQLLDNKLLYYGGLQFDSYFSNRFHYSVNGLYYNVDMTKEYAVEANLRLTYYVSRRFGISAACKGAYVHVANEAKIACLPFLDFTYLVNPGRTTIKHGLYKNKRRGR